MYTRVVRSEFKKELYQKDQISIGSLHSINIPVDYDHGGKLHTLEYESKDNAQFYDIIISII
jgi:hypothetical protein